MSTRIEWCDETINPLGHWCFGVGGTKDDPKPCEYCYARRMAVRGISRCGACKTFDTPHTHFERLGKLVRWKKPRTIFVQSMGDLFHDSVPDSWIEAVFEACAAAPRHRYLFLTKNPERYGNLHDNGLLPARDNFWFGASMTNPAQKHHIANNLPHYFGRPQPTHRNTFVGVEPILDDIEGVRPTGGFFTYYHSAVKWAILGAETGNRRGKVIPERKWVENIVAACDDAGIPVFMKNSLLPIMGRENMRRELPWERRMT